jgi:small-conductance mechanosensitive channel
MSADFLQSEWLGNTVADYGLAIATIVVGFMAIALIRVVVMARLRQWAARTATDLDDRLLGLIEQPTARLLGLGVIYLSVGNLSLHPILQDTLNVVCVIIATLFVVQLTGSLVEYGVRVYWVTKRGDATLEQSLNAIVPAIKVVVWTIGAIFLLDNLGFDISAVVASLGIGGIAIALAAQGILGDLFSYFSILLDRPFEIGDFIIVGDLVGTVEQVGIKTTRLRSLTGEELVAANTDLTSSRIQNFKRMERRRIVFSLGVTYETAQDHMQQIPELIQSAVEKTDHVTFDRAHFGSFGDFSLNYEVVYYVESSDYAVYMDAQQTINLAIKSAFESAGIEFAYPTQVLYLADQQGEANPQGNGRSADLVSNHS